MKTVVEESVLWINPEYPYLAATPDGILYHVSAVGLVC